MDNKDNNIHIDIDYGFLWIMTFILMIAKIWGNLSISWILVFAPLWLPVALVLGITFLIIIIGVILWIIDRLR